MNAAFGTLGVAIGFAGSLLGISVLVYALVKKRTDMLHLSSYFAVLLLAAAVLCFAAMERGLITRDFTMRYVAENGSTRTPALFNFATLWGALEGSILLWTLILCGYLAAIVFKFRKRRTDPLVAWAVVVMLVVALFFFGLMLGPANPFRTLASAPLDGPGPNPLLQDNVLMAFHPPMLYLGYVGFTVPFAFATAALITGRLGEGWLVETRRWTLFAFTFLTIGIVLGAWWSYEVLGWGGYWAWDPVENASLLPWLTGVAYLHSVMVQERRAMLRVWNLSLLCATFSLTILGTFLTRSGVLNSVHAFSNSNIGPLLLGFFGVIVAVSLGLIGWRGDRLRSPGRIDSPLSREGAFLANNLLFAAFAFVVLLGTVFPLIVEAVQNKQLTIGGPYFNRLAGPIAIALLFIMAVAPVLPWRKASSDTLRHRLLIPAWVATAAVVLAVALGGRGIVPLIAFGLGGFVAGSAVRQLVLATRRQGVRGMLGRTNGGMVVHLGVAIVAVAFAASSSYANRVEFTGLKPGQTVTVSGHKVTYESWRDIDKTQYTAQVVALRVDGHKMQYPMLRRYPAGNQVVGTPSVWSTPTHDSYMALLDLDPSTSEISLRVIVEPMVMWLWIGGAVMAAGTVLAAFPGKRRRRPTDPASAPIPGLGHRPRQPSPVSARDSAPEPPQGEPEPVGVSP